MLLRADAQPGMYLPVFHAGQEKVFEQARRFNWLSAGRRWRKTTMCMSIAVLAALKGQEILWGAPTHDQCRVGWDELRTACTEYATFHEGRMECRIGRKGIIRFRSLDDPNNARGHTADGTVIDEAADVSALAWPEVIRPMLIDTDGWGWIIGTPRGRNWFWQGWLEASQDDMADSIAWQAPSLGAIIHDGRLIRDPHPLENPELPFSEIQQVFASQPERSFRQELLAEFVEDGGGVFRGLNRVCMLEPEEPIVTHIYTVGVDWGRSNDYTAISVIDCTKRIARQVKLDRFSQIGYEVQLGRLRAILDAYKPIAIVAELNSMGGPLVERLQSDGYPVEGFQTTSASKKGLVEDYALAIERADLMLLSDGVQKLELESIQQETLPGGMIRYSAPTGMHDDTMIAGALAWYRAKADFDWIKEEQLETPQEEFKRMVQDYGPPRPQPVKTGWGKRDERKGRW